MSGKIMKASISFHCTSCRGKIDEILLQNLKLEIEDNPDLICKMEGSQVIIEGCFRTEEGLKRTINGHITCIHWTDSSLFLTQSKHMRSTSTVMIQVDTPKNHFITLHCNFEEKRVIFMDSLQCTNGLEMYPELASTLEKVMIHLDILPLQFNIQKEIDDGFFYSVMNSLTVESSNKTTFDVLLKEITTFQSILKITLNKRKNTKDQNFLKYNDLKKSVNEKIKYGIETGETLEMVKESVKTEWPKLTRDSDVYVELKYVKRIADNFLFLLHNHLKTHGSSHRIFLSKVQNISEIKDIKEPFNTITNYEQLQKCAAYFDSKTKLRFFKGFHDLCRRYSTVAHGIEIDERNFLKEFQKQLVRKAFGMPSASDELSEYLQDSLMKLGDDKIANYLLKQFAKSKCESLLEIRGMALTLLESQSESFVESVESLVKKINEKVSTKFVTENDMNIFRCEGSFVDLVKVKTELEANLHLFDKCTQIEILAEICFCVNCSVNWLGKNVILVTDTLIVDERQQHYSLNVSGKNGPTPTERKALDGTRMDSDGLAGEPGMHGESGGNVQIIANVFKTEDYMSVISTGGNGSNGQDGGIGVDGVNGANGEEISEIDLYRRCPLLSNYMGNLVGVNINDFKKNIQFNSISQEIPANPLINEQFSMDRDYYVKGETNDHHLVEYGFWSSINLSHLLGALFSGSPMRQAYCICYGQPGTSGTPGGNGGKGGAGGKGGFEGNVDIKNWKGKHICTIKTTCHPGQCGSDGKDGIGGKGGKNGKQGNDRAYVYPGQAQSTRVFRGHLDIVSFDESSQERAFCPKRKKYIDIITTANAYLTLQNCKDGEKGTSTKRVYNRLTESARTKKSPIVFQKIKERYQQMFFAMNDGERLQYNVETMIDATTLHYSYKHTKKVIKNTMELDFQNSFQRSNLAMICITKKSPQRQDTHKPTFKRNRHSGRSMMTKVEELLAAAKEKSEHEISGKEIKTCLDTLDQISRQDSFDEKNYEQLLELIDLMKNKCIKANMKEIKSINYWHDRIFINYKFCLLENVNDLIKLYTEGKKMEMDLNDPCSKTIMKDLQFESKTMLEDLIFNVLESNDVLHLKSIDMNVKTKLEDLVHEITIYRRTVSIFADDTKMCFEKGTVCKTESENMNKLETEFQMDSDVEIETESTFETDNKPKIEKQKQIDLKVEIGKVSKHEVELTNESGHEEGIASPDNDAELNDELLELESDSDLNALIDWSISHKTSNAEVCCIIKKLRYIQSENIFFILKCLRYRLINQTCQISVEFLRMFLIRLLENEECIENGVILRLVAATKPENWIFEWIIQEVMCRSDVEDELICRELLSKIHGHKIYLFLCRYLSKLDEGVIMTKSTVEVMMGSLHTLNPVIEDSFLIALESINVFEWGCIIKWNDSITALQSLSLPWQDDSKLLDAAYYSSQIINRYGKEFVDKIYRCVKAYPVGADIFLSALKRMNAGSLSINIKELSLVQNLADAMSIFGKSSVHQGKRTNENIWSSMYTDSNTTLLENEVKEIRSILEEIDKKGLVRSTLLASTHKEGRESNEYITKCISSFSENDIKAWSIVYKRQLMSNPQQFPNLFTEMVSVIDRAIALRRGFGLRNTQKISIIAFNLDLVGRAKSNGGILQQMSTGEGKTIVIVVLSILKALNDEKVDIITSSSVLAKRDTDLNQDIFDLFGISVSNNCSTDKHDRQDAYCSLVVYGEIGTFQRDILLTEFYNENIIGGRNQKNVIVDEVDSMLLDRGETVLYLSHEIAGIDALEFVYTFIWSLVHSKEMIGTDRDRKLVRRCLLDAMYGVISIEDISKCSPLENVAEIWKMLTKEKIIDDEGQLLTRSYASFAKLENIKTGNACDTGYLINMLKDTVRKGILVEVPKFLDSFIKRHLDTWIKNAFHAKCMTEGKHFIIDIDRTPYSRGKDVNIVIMDVDTGTEQYNMQWNSGLHQFLQLKYKCAISAESLKAVFMSNISFFRLYTSLNGLTGTLGSQKERNLLKDMYNVRYITIPTFQEPRFIEHDTILCNSTDNWLRSIRETAASLSELRPVLVICETINSCEELEKELTRNGMNAYIYKNSYCELSILNNKTELESGCIILATNLAGRGTDIRISENISDHGGLHVILTYLPSNIRTEEQAFGRAARKGQEGSGQLIICDCMEDQQTTTEILTISQMKRQRDMAEIERVSKIQQRYETFIQTEERLFKKFQTYYNDLKRIIATKTDAEFQNVLLQALLDLWAFWLDTVEMSMKRSINVPSVMDKLGAFFKAIDDSGVHYDSTKIISLLQSPSQLVQSGKAKIITKNYNEALAFFDKVLKNDPSFSESALYYKVHCLLKMEARTYDDYKTVRNTLGNCKFLIKQRIEQLRNAVQTVNIISSQYTYKRKTITLSDGFVKQKQNVIQMYYQIIDSIDSITGYAIESFMFVDSTCSLLDATMIFNDLHTIKILSHQRVRKFSKKEPAWQSIEKSYRLYSKEILSKLKELKDEDHVTAANFQGVLPSREELWELLKDQGILKDTNDCILLNDAELQRSVDKIPQSITDILNSLTDNSLMDNIENYIFLYPDQKDKILAKDTKIIPIQVFKEKIGFGKIFEVLQREKLVFSCSFAVLAPNATDMVLRGTLQKFDHVDCNVFVEIDDVSIETSREIFSQLMAKEIVSLDGKLLIFELGNNWLSSYSKYSSDVRNIVAKFSKYRICALHLSTEKEFPIDLFSHPHDILFKDLIETGIVTPVKIKANIKKDEITKKLSFLYGYDNDKDSREENCHLFSGQPKILSSEINDLCRGFCFSGIELEKELIEQGICLRENPKDDFVFLLKNDELKKTSLQQNIRNIENEMKCFMSSRMKNYLNISGIESQVNKWRDGLAKFENVDPELQSLADSFTEEQLIDLCDEIVSVTNNGFGELIVLTERKWTIKSICNMICILVIGLIQISIAMAVEFYSIGAGTFVANALLSEGIGDVMFAVECMISGHCSMQSYLQHKVLSMTLTVVAGGIGAMIARGAQFSRFGYKIGGQFLKTKSACKLIKEGVSTPLLAKVAAKRIGNKIVEITSLKLVDAGVDFAIEKALRASLITLCEAITDNTFEVSQETRKSLTDSISTLAKTVGLHNTETIIEKLIGNLTFHESDISMILTKFSHVANVFCSGLDEAMEKLVISGDSRVKNVSKIASIVDKIGKGLNIVNAVQEVLSLKMKTLEQFYMDIKRKSNFKDENVEHDVCYSWACDQTDKAIKKVNSEVSKYLEMHLENIVVKPMLQKVGRKLQDQISKGVSELYHYGQKCVHRSDFRKLKAAFLSKQQSLSDSKDYTNLQYNKALLNLLKKTRSPSLFADIVEEGIPLGIHSVQAISEITGVVINIETIGGDAITMPQKFTPSATYFKKLGCITLQFHVNPETGIGHFESSKGTHVKSKKYDCLLTAVLQETGFQIQRPHLAKIIRTNYEIRKNTKQGLHEHFIFKGGIGGVIHKRTILKSPRQIYRNRTLLTKCVNELGNLKNKNTIKARKLIERIKKYKRLKKSLRDAAKNTHNSVKGTGNDELYELHLFEDIYAPTCIKGNAKYIEPTKILFGSQYTNVNYGDAFYNCRVDTRYVVFIVNGSLHGHTGALYETLNKDNFGARTLGQANFHTQRSNKINENLDDHLFSILSGLEAHLESLPTKQQLQEIDLKDCYSAIGYNLGIEHERDKFIIALEREKYKLCSAAEHLTSCNMIKRKSETEKQTAKDKLKSAKEKQTAEDKLKSATEKLTAEDKLKSATKKQVTTDNMKSKTEEKITKDNLKFEHFTKFFCDLKSKIELDAAYKSKVEDLVNKIDSLQSFGDVLKDPAPHY